VSDPLTTYLQDHLDGATHAIATLKAIRDHYAEKLLGPLASDLLVEIEADRDVLGLLTENTGRHFRRTKRMGRMVGRESQSPET
jgi:hypothetical protein